jgi:hypothetical protein
VYFYKTAWSPLRVEVLEAMAKQFPKLHFRMAFAERGSAYKGYYEAGAGEITDESSENVSEDDWEPDDPQHPDEGSHYKHDDEFKDLLESSG